ncbi:uncharacterized protein G2W53_040992 [Senna tora]|uniref:Uncharacterized protein n=1 Tax=Senna tora TaxID=362788 RepID=A0A834SF09_9FABA|nr:uncharacterized protein G2W53_040992 [Senna tora]
MPVSKKVSLTKASPLVFLLTKEGNGSCGAKCHSSFSMQILQSASSPQEQKGGEGGEDEGSSV